MSYEHQDIDSIYSQGNENLRNKLNSMNPRNSFYNYNKRSSCKGMLNLQMRIMIISIKIINTTKYEIAHCSNIVFMKSKYSI